MKTTKLFLAIVTTVTLLFTSCKKTETFLPIDSQIETSTDKSFGTDSWIVSKAQLSGRDIHLQPTTFTFDKNKIVVNSGEIIATSTISILSNDEILIDGFDITQFKSKIDPTLIELLESTSGIFKYQKNATRIVLTAPGVSIYLLQGGQKNLSIIQQNDWKVIDFICIPKNISLQWIDGPKMTFGNNIVTTSFNNMSCSRQYIEYASTVHFKPNNCSLNDINVEIMLDLFQGDYDWTILSNGNLEIKNNNRTKVVLAPVNTLTTTSNTNHSIQ